MTSFSEFQLILESQARIEVLEKKYKPLFQDALRERFSVEQWWKEANDHHPTPGYTDSIVSQSANRLLNHGVDIDPTREYKYLDWIYRMILKIVKKQVLNSYDRLPEDVVGFHDSLAQYDELKTKNKIPQHFKDINTFKSFAELHEIIAPIWKAYTTEKTFEITDEGVRPFGKDITTFYKGPLGAVYIPHTEAASRYLGKQTKWCTAYPDSPTWFSRYNAEGPLFVIVDKFGTRTQLHLQSGQVMDVQDHPITPQIFRYSDIWKHLGEEMLNQQLNWTSTKVTVREFYDMLVLGYDIGRAPPPGIEKSFLHRAVEAKLGSGDRSYLRAYARSFGASPSVLKAVLEMRNIQLIRDIATSVLTERWPEGEKMMISIITPYDYEVLYGYWKEHFKPNERWLAAEHILSHCAHAIMFYPSNRTPLPAMEAVLTDPHSQIWESGGYRVNSVSRALYLSQYAIHKLEKPWPASINHMIQEHHDSWENYRQHFGLPF